MSYQDPGFRPSGWEIAGDHETRIGILEATPPTSAASSPTFMRLSTQFGNQFATDSQVAPLVLDWEFGGFTFTPGSDPSTPATWMPPVAGYYSLAISCDALLNFSGVDELIMEASGWNPDSSQPFDSYLEFDGSIDGHFGTQFRAPMVIVGQIHAVENFGSLPTIQVIWSSSHEWLVSHVLVTMELIKAD